MTLMRTLARVAVGIAAAKGAQKLTQSARAGRSGTMLDDLLGPGTATDGQPGDSRSRLDELLSGRGRTRTGEAAEGGLSGGLGGLLAGTGLGGLLDGLTAPKDTAAAPADRGGSFGRVLNSQFDSTDEPPAAPSAEQEEGAAVMLATMIQAARADGHMDEDERKRIMDNLGDLDGSEQAFVQNQMTAPVDAAALGRSAPKGLGPQVYAMALLAIDLDNNAEAKFLDELATSLGLGRDQVNGIHDRLNQPALYK